MATQEVRIPIKQKQFQLVKELQRAVQDLDRQAMMAVQGIAAGADVGLTPQAQFRGVSDENGVFTLIFHDVTSEPAPETPVTG